MVDSGIGTLTRLKSFGFINACSDAALRNHVIAMLTS